MSNSTTQPAEPAVPATTFSEALKEMLASKKFIAMVLGLVFTALSNMGWHVAEATQEQTLNLIMVYILGQGVADAGSGFAKARNTTSPAVTNAV